MKTVNKCLQIESEGYVTYFTLVLDMFIFIVDKNIRKCFTKNLQL